MNIYVIIVTYKGHHWYRRCFDSLRHSTIPIQTIVVDNASNDGTIEFIEENYPEIILFKSNENLGFGQGNNMGLKYAIQNNCDYVFLLNQDAWIEPDSINELINVSKNNSDYGILGPMLIDSTKNNISSKFEAYFNGIQDSLFIEDIYFDRPKDIYPIKMLPAAVWLIPRNILIKVGGFDPIFYHYGEDDHYVQRVKFFGYKIGFCPKVKVVHDSENIMLEGKTKFVDSSAIMRRVLLTEWVDINKEFSVIIKLKQYILHMIKLLLKFKFSRIAVLYGDSLYLIKIRNKVKISRSLSINPQIYWLNNNL